MKRIGILSDTHAYWDNKYLEYFRECDEIWHAGDIGSVELADRLAAFRPLRAVVGNCDGGDLRRMFPKLLRWTCEGADILMTHIGGYPGRYDRSIIRQLIERPPHLFVCGHSHILKVHSCHMGQNFISFMVNIVVYRYPIFCLSIYPLMTPGLLLLSNLVKKFF